MSNRSVIYLKSYFTHPNGVSSEGPEPCLTGSILLGSSRRASCLRVFVDLSPLILKRSKCFFYLSHLVLHQIKKVPVWLSFHVLDGNKWGRGVRTTDYNIIYCHDCVFENSILLFFLYLSPDRQCCFFRIFRGISCTKIALGLHIRHRIVYICVCLSIKCR